MVRSMYWASAPGVLGEYMWTFAGSEPVYVVLMHRETVSPGFAPVML
jgi:hypothetical protein